MNMAELQEILRQGIRHHQQGDLAAAEACYERILTQTPEFPDALNFLGVLKHQNRLSATGIALIGKAIQIAPDYFDAYANIGRIFMDLELFERAEGAFAKAVELKPDHAGAQRGLALAKTQVQVNRDRIENLRQTIADQPDDPQNIYLLGLELMRQKKLDEAETALLRTLELEPLAREAYYQLFRVYFIQNKQEAIESVLNRWLENIPDDPNAQHMRWAVTGEHTPERASNEYVQECFDKFAASFDQVLQTIDYRAPGLIGDRVKVLAEANGPFAKVLDAGCGTGLCGPLVKPYAGRLIGVDLSQKMLDKALPRGCYDELIQGELTQFIAEHPLQYDLIISADTLVYFGVLGPVIQASRQALFPGGRLLFTVEKLDTKETKGFALNHEGRYSHTQDYVAGTLNAEGFVIDFIATTILRFEGGKAVVGLLVSAAKPWLNAHQDKENFSEIQA
jgi:predicted TPR repeat methyltransferase